MDVLRTARGSCRAAAVAALMVTAACGGSTVRGDYGVFYTMGPDAYDDAAAQRDLKPCLEIDGAEDAGAADSLPPQLSIDFAGTTENQRRLEECLRGLPGTRITGLTASDPTPQTS
jgi:hypothetical protein